MSFTAEKTVLGTKAALAAIVIADSEEYFKNTLFVGSNFLLIVLLTMIMEPLTLSKLKTFARKITLLIDIFTI
ncbi:pterin-4-alpha-carbinolamine dehydratase [Vibrio sp. AND4]|nr:pterin-4-alpha-carbinolamine dehydratase [Vibrio sp. AND4]